MLRATAFAALLPWAAVAADEPPFEMVSRLPAIYAIDYGTEMRESWQVTVDGYAQAPPDMLHL